MKALAIPCPHQPPIKDDNIVLVAKAVLPLLALPSILPQERVFKRNIHNYIYIYTPDQLKAENSGYLFIFIFSAVCDFLKNGR